MTSGADGARRSSQSRIVVTVPVSCTGERLDRALAEQLEEMFSRSTVQRLIRDGALRLQPEDRPVQDVNFRLAGGETFHLDIPAPEPLAAEPEAIPLQVLFEDDDLMVLDKAAGMVVHPGAGVRTGTLVNALLHHAASSGALSTLGGSFRPGIVHRLDKDTSGLMVVAKHDMAHQHLAGQFHDHTAFRHYLAVVHGTGLADRGTVNAVIGRHPVHRVRMAVNGVHGRPAVTHYLVLERFRHFTHVVCRLETGRTHQIRVHMAHMGYPLCGDPVYGRPGSIPPPVTSGWPDPARATLRGFQRQALHAAQLEFTHPVSGERQQYTSPPPEDFLALLEVLRAYDVERMTGPG